MSKKRIPISVARDVANRQKCRQVILLAWDGELTHIVTYGKTAEDCAQAATGGNILKQKWGWPECNDQPSRVKKLAELLADAEAALAHAINRDHPFAEFCDACIQGRAVLSRIRAAREVKP